MGILFMKRLLKLSRRFRHNQSGNIAILFCFSLTLLCFAAGAAVDYSRASNSRTALQSAVDAAILVAGKDALTSGQRASVDSIKRLMLSNLKPENFYLVDRVDVTQSGTELVVNASASVKLAFRGVVGKDTTEVGVSASVPLGSRRLEIVFALDSTGSMAALGKMDALKKAATDLVDILTQSQKAGTEVAFGVVPFTTQVRVPVGFAYADWIDFKTTDPNPVMNANRADWDGCIMDRDKPNNTKSIKPTPNKPDEAFPAQKCTSPNLQTILPITTNTFAVKAKINSLIAEGNTNTTIGLAWAYNLLTAGNPLSDGTSSSSNAPMQAIVFLTDGLNTADRFSQPPAMMDQDMAELCKNAKSPKIRVFTIKVIEGNEALIKGCASKPEDFYTVNEASGLYDAFRSITNKLTTLRLSS
jgi:Flp pilus assembly protein TadG